MIPSVVPVVKCKQCGAAVRADQGARLDGVRINGLYKTVSADGHFHTVACLIAFIESVARRAGVEDLSSAE